MARKNKSILISYKNLRKLIGILGMALPVLVICGGLLAGYPVQDSISDYYFTNMRDFFVGLLIAVGFFLITYKGRTNTDNLVTIFSGAAAVGIALFPVAGSSSSGPYGLFMLSASQTTTLHLLSALSFTLLLAINCLCLFTRIYNPQKSQYIPDYLTQKTKRNRVYKVCGTILLISTGLIFLYLILLQDTFWSRFKPVLILESIALWAFGISWLVKGQAIFKDIRPGNNNVVP